MEIFNEIEPLRAFLAGKRTRSSSVGLVPTMGALHEGHASLIQASRSANDITVCSLFVNPTQFNNKLDLEKYPRTIEQDQQLLTAEGCDVLFMPESNSMYEHQPRITFDFGQLDKILEGQYRPGHFSGVALIVSKLFNIVQPDHAYFGQKDYQQFQVISSLVTELKFNITLHCMPIVRDGNGLAMSSRNQRLSSDGKTKAAALYENLTAGKIALLGNQPWEKVREEIIKRLSSISGVNIEYLELARHDDLTLLQTPVPEGSVILVAAFVDEIRLIDNILLHR